MSDIYQEYVHLARLALSGNEQDVIALLKKDTKIFMKYRPELAVTIKQLIKSASNNVGLTRHILNDPLPIDTDSKLELIKREFTEFEKDPIWSDDVMSKLYSIIEEREFEDKLYEFNLAPTRTILFTGPPGVGKTYAAKWISAKLNRPLFTLDLAAVMSSYLGKTGNNLRTVLDYAQKIPSVLLLDEFDAIAKKRDDDSDIGELKRLVNVLLQAIDEWSSKGVLIAATNHPELLDSAVWRRFENTINFPNPTSEQIRLTITDLLGREFTNEMVEFLDTLSIAFEGFTYAEITMLVNNAKRESIIKQLPLINVLEKKLNISSKELSKNGKIQLAKKLVEQRYSQRKVAELTGLSRETVRKYTKDVGRGVHE